MKTILFILTLCIVSYPMISNSQSLRVIYTGGFEGKVKPFG